MSTKGDVEANPHYHPVMQYHVIMRILVGDSLQGKIAEVVVLSIYAKNIKDVEWLKSAVNEQLMVVKQPDSPHRIFDSTKILRYISSDQYAEVFRDMAMIDGQSIIGITIEAVSTSGNASDEDCDMDYDKALEEVDWTVRGHYATNKGPIVYAN